MNSDIFGFYQVSNYKTYSKLEAIDYKNVYGGNIHWNFNDELFSSVDWTNEPQSSLWDLYKQRVKQIREKYDYCVLWYSGGSDSHNILHAWLDSGYKLDEIATKYILGQNFQDMIKLTNSKHCDDLVIITSKILKKSYLSDQIQAIYKRISEGENENIEDVVDINDSIVRPVLSSLLSYSKIFIKQTLFKV